MGTRAYPGNKKHSGESTSVGTSYNLSDSVTRGYRSTYIIDKTSSRKRTKKLNTSKENSLVTSSSDSIVRGNVGKSVATHTIFVKQR